MPLSVKVRLDYHTDGVGTWGFLTVHTGGQEGTLSPIPYDQLFGHEWTVILQPPQGGMKIPAKEVKRRSARQERQRIEAVGGHRHSGSGARSGYKSDGSLGYRWRMENKFTAKESFRVQLKELRKLRSECLNGQAPVFNVDFQDKYTGESKESWVLVPSKEWERLVNATSDNS